MEQTWIVLLEAAGDSSQSPIDIATLRLLMASMEGDQVVALHSPYRYGLQLQVGSMSAAGAVFAATSRWEGAVRRLGLPTWALQRLELMTPEEFARDFVVIDVTGATEPAAPDGVAGDQPSPALVLLQGGTSSWTGSENTSAPCRRRTQGS